MISNKKIAIDWATKSVREATGFVYSDQFFMPFSRQETCLEIAEELLDQGVHVWPDLKQGAFLFKKNDPRLVLSFQEKCVGGAWLEGNNVLILPTMYS